MVNHAMQWQDHPCVLHTFAGMWRIDHILTLPSGNLTWLLKIAIYSRFTH